MKQATSKLLIVDSNPEPLAETLSDEGYEVCTANNGIDAYKAAKKEQADLILLDIMLPGMDGIELCEKLRDNKQFDHTFIVVLTERNESYSEIASFEACADGYIAKPIKTRVLTARLKAILNRRSYNNNPTVKKIGNITIDNKNHIIKQNNEEIKLTQKEYELLLLLSSKVGKVFSRKLIYEKIWGDGLWVGGRTIDVHIRKLRSKIGKEYIKTFKGIGYKLIAP